KAHTSHYFALLGDEDAPIHPDKRTPAQKHLGGKVRYVLDRIEHHLKYLPKGELEKHTQFLNLLQSYKAALQLYEKYYKTNQKPEPMEVFDTTYQSDFFKQTPDMFDKENYLKTIDTKLSRGQILGWLHSSGVKL